MMPTPLADELVLCRAACGIHMRGLLYYGWPLYNASIESNATTVTLVELGKFYNRSGSRLVEGRLLDFTCNSQDTLEDILRGCMLY
jgi:hypothetical protein